MSTELTIPTYLCIYPSKVLDKMSQFDGLLRSAVRGFDPDTAEYFAVQTLSWDTASTVTVAFLGGDSALHKKIAMAARKWTQHANLHLDFGLDPATGGYRTWSRNDTTYSADIRIAFDQSGYWSTIGAQSRNDQVTKANEASMSLSRFDKALPSDWETVAIHEFGHALGFKHEHQHPEGGCDDEYRWWDDLEYKITPLPNSQNISCVFAFRDTIVSDANGKRPGLYRITGGWPNYWPMCKIDHNIRQQENSSAYLVGPYDGKSIMKYRFPAFMYRKGKQSPCYSEENNVLSDGDKEGAARLYPHKIEQVQEVSDRMTIFLDQALSLEAIKPDVQEFLEQQRTRFQSK